MKWLKDALTKKKEVVEGLEELTQEHKDLVKALESRDPKLLKEQLKRQSEELKEFLEKGKAK